MCWLADQPGLLELFADVDRAGQGFLPESGGVWDQDAQFVEGWEILRNAQSQLQMREAKIQRAQEARQLADLQKKRGGRR